MKKGTYKLDGKEKDKNVLVLCNYKWYKEYTWHLKQLDKSFLKGSVFLINFAEIDHDKNNFLNLIKKTLLLLRYVKKSKIIIFDGFIGIWFYCLVFSGLLNNKYKIAATQNYNLPVLSFNSLIKYLFLKQVYKKFHLIILPSNQFKSILGRYFGEKIKRKLIVLFSPINFEDKKNYLTINKEVGNYVLSCGQANRDYKLLSKVLKNYKNKVLINCPFEIFKKSNFNNNVSFKKTKNTIEIIELIKNAKLVVIPLKDELVTSGLRVLYWALELGKPIIISKCNHLVEIFGNNPPFIYVEIKNELKLRNAISELENNRNELISLGKKAREWSLINNTSAEFVNTLWNDYVNKFD